MSLLAIRTSPPRPSARRARGGREAPALWGGRSGAARGLAARKGGAAANRAAGGPVSASHSAVMDPIRDLLASFEAPDQVRRCGGTR
jgi:hypothetical protein